MATDFCLPALGADMEAATLVEWRIKPGDRVKHGDVVAAVETDKGVIDVEAFDEGVVQELVVAPGTRVAVGAVLARLAGGETSKAAPPQPASRPRPAAPVPAGKVEPAPPAARLRVSPAARARAQELGIALEGLAGTGPGGAISLADVERAAARPATAPPARSMQQAIAAAMARSKREIPHYYLSLTADFGPAAAWLEAHNARVPVTERVLYAALVLHAVARAAHELEGFNGHFVEDSFRPAAAVHLGVAIALRGGGLVAPAILDAEAKPLAALMTDFRDLVTRARAGRLRASEFSAPTITVTSLGEIGVDAVFPVIHPPQVAMVGVGGLLRRPWLVGDSIVPRPVLTLSLAGDHRVTDGRRGAQFLDRIRALLENPEAA